MSRATYIGSFPPPYGGVTVKNSLLFKHLAERIDIELIDMSAVKRRDLGSASRFVRAVLSRRGALVLGLSEKWRIRVTNFLFLFNRRKMERSVLFVMGGRIPDDPVYASRLNGFKRVYVETGSMRSEFEALGVRNVSVYPNCRERPVTSCTPTPSRGGVLSSMFFSLISEEKGARLVLDAARALPGLRFSFYGRIDPLFEADFLRAVGELPNVTYMGVFDSVHSDVYAEMNKYDVHIFPTMCPNEGVPGVIPEAKIAAVPTIASDRCFNSELVADGVDGILTHEDTAEELAGVLAFLSERPDLLDSMKRASRDSAELYYIDRYIDWVAREVAA